MASWIGKQVGLDAQALVPEAQTTTDFHSRLSGRYEAIVRGQAHSGHGHSHDGAHGHSHHGHAPDEPQTVETACGGGDLAQLILLYAQGVDVVNRVQPHAGTEAPPLMWAALKGHLPIIKFLVDRGADVHCCTADGQNALHWAATEGRYEVADALLQLGARPTDSDVRGYNAFFVAVQATNLAMLVLLAEAEKPDPKMVDSQQHTLMHWAAYRGSLALCQYVHEVLGVAADTMDDQRRTPLHWAAREGHDDVCAYLLSKGARPGTTDADGLTPLAHATERHQRHVVVVLSQNLHEVASRRRASTLGLIVLDRAALISSLLGVGYVIVAFTAMLFIPSVFAHMAFGLYFGKNLAFTMLYKMPPNHPSQASGELNEFRKLATASGIPRSFGESVQSLDYVLRRREPANIFAILTFFAVQNVSLLTAQIELGVVYWALLLSVVLTITLTKHTAMRSVVPAGSIHDSATIRCVREKRFKMLQSRLVNQEKHIQLPLRSFYCVEIDEIVRMYDSYSVALDAPIGEANLHWFGMFVISFTLLQLSVFLTSFEQLSQRLCTTEPPRSGVLWGIVFHALPCAIAPLDDSWLSFLCPTALNSAGVWIIDFAFVTFVMGLIVCGRTIGPFTYGCTRKELINPTAPTQDGDLVPIIRSGGNKTTTIFAEGGVFTNLLFLFSGRLGQRWRGLYAVPAPPSL